MSSLWETLKSPFVWAGQSVSSAVSATPAAPVVSDSAVVETLGVAPEEPGVTTTGGRRRKTRRHKKSRKSKKTRKH